MGSVLGGWVLALKLMVPGRPYADATVRVASRKAACEVADVPKLVVPP